MTWPSSTVLLILAALMIGGGLLVSTGAVNLMALLMAAALGIGLMLMNIYLPPIAILIIAVCTALGSLFAREGTSLFGYIVIGLLIVGLAVGGQFYLPQETLVKLSLTVVFLAAVRFLLR